MIFTKPKKAWSSENDTDTNDVKDAILAFLSIARKYKARKHCAIQYSNLSPIPL